MRIYLKTTSTSQVLPYNYQEYLVGTFHKWLGDNTIHDKMSLYSLSWLSGGEGQHDGLRFNRGATWFISTPSAEILTKVIEGVQKSPSIAFGLKVNEIIIKKTPSFSPKEQFFLQTPVLIKRTIGQKTKYYTYQDPEAGKLLTATLKNKLRKAKLSDQITIEFDKSYARPKEKLVTYRGIKNKASLCPVVLSGAPDAIAFAWDVGIGNSTGIGFGALK